MAFILQNFQFNRGTLTANAQGQGFTPIIHSYKSTTDTRATIAGASYFPPNIDGEVDKVFVGDALFIVGSDGTSLCMFTALDPVTLGTDLLVSGPSLTVGAPIAAVDLNAIRIAGNVAQMEIANATHPGIITIGSQTFSGTKAFNDGINVFGAGILTDNVDSTAPGNALTLGAGALNVTIGTTPLVVNLIQSTGLGVPLVLGTSSQKVTIDAPLFFTTGSGTITTFAENNSAVSWSGPFAAPVAGSLTSQKINQQVYLSVPNINLTAAVNNTAITSGVILPVGFRPIVPIKGILQIASNTTAAVGSYSINVDGSISIFADLNGGSFAAAGTASFDDFSVIYIAA